MEEEPRRSYHLFFVSPADGFEFEAQTETETEPDFEEYESEEEFVEWETETVQGLEHIGWSVAVSLIAP